jgi:transposase
VEQLKDLGVKVALVAYEAGPTGFSLARALESSGMAVAVVAPSRVMRPVSSGAKTDRLDCLKLAGLALRGMLRPIAVPSKEEEAIRSLNRRSHGLTDRIRKVKSRIKSHLLFLGVEEPAGLRCWSRSSISALKKLELPLGAALTLESLIRELKRQIEEREWVWEKLKELLKDGEQQDDVTNLRSIPGVGPITARTFCLELFRPGRFNRAEEVSSYLGLAPMVRHSGLGKPTAYIRPVGQRRLRSLLVEACWIWKRYDSYAKDFYNRLLSRCGSSQKTIVALARKLAVVMWRLCVEKRVYRPGSVPA